jgi:hypothetical protein
VVVPALFKETGIVRHGEGTRYFSKSVTCGFNLYDNLEKRRMLTMYASREEAIAERDRLHTEERGFSD